MRLLATIIAGGARGLSGASVQQLDCPPACGQHVYFANHTSHLDFVVLWSILPERERIQTRPVAAKDYWSSGVRKHLAVNVFNAILVERSLQPHGSGAENQAKKSLELMASALDEGNSLILFPEGTRGDGQEIGEFKSGMYYLWQRRPDVQFTPVFIHNLNRILPKGEVLPVPVISRIVFGPPLTLAPDESKGSFLGKSRDALCALKKYVIHD